MKLLWRFASSLLLVAMALPGGTVLAQSYPNKPIRIVVPFPPGGNADVIARLVGAELATAMDVPVIVDNRPGAASRIAMESVARAAPDGHTILINTNGQAIIPAVYRKLSFDPVKDFAPVTQLTTTTLLIVASKRSPAKTVQELIALAKAKPHTLNYGSTGVGIILHLAMEMLKLQAGIDIVAIPYKGSAPMQQALLAGEIDVAVTPLTSALPHIKTGTLHALAMTGPHRSPQLPNVPTVAESGLPGYEATSWQGFFVAAKTPPSIISKIQQETARALKLPDVRKRLEAYGNEIVGSTPAQFDKTLIADRHKFAKLVNDAHIPMQD